MNTEQVPPQNLKPGDVVLGVGNNDDRRVRQVGDRDVRWNELEIIFEDNSRVWYRYDQLITVQRSRTSP
jgi:hypothetical protein